MPRYEIQPVDTLTSISRKLGVSIEHLIRMNNFGNVCYPSGTQYIYY